MATFVLEAHDAVTDAPGLRGTMSPLNVVLAVHEAPTEARPSTLPAWNGQPGAVLEGVIPPVLDPPGSWSCAVGAADGTLFGALDATPVSLGWELDGIGSDSIYMPALAPTAELLFDPLGRFRDGREVETYLDLEFVKSTIPNPNQDSGPPTTLDLSGVGFLYNLRRTYVGRLNPQPNLAANPHFTSDTSGWTTYGGAVATWVPAPAPPDGQVGAAQLSLSSVGYGGIFQDIEVGGHPFDTVVWVTVQIRVAAGVFEYMVPPDGAGMEVELFIGGVSVWTQLPDPGDGPDWRVKDTYQQMRMKVYIPTSGALTMRLKLRAPENIAYHSQVVVTQDERLYASGQPADIIASLVAHAQDTGIGKQQRFITTRTAGTGGGVLINRAYKYRGRQQILTAMGEMATMDGGVDWLGEQPARTTREVVNYDRGGYDPGLMAELRWGYNLVSYAWVWGTDQHADRVIVLGRGDGFEPGEGIYVDDDSDLGWEYVRAAPIEGFVDPDVAAAGIGKALAAPLTLRVVAHRAAGFDPADLVKAADGRLLPARLVDVDIVEGQVYVRQQMKITRTRLNCEAHTAELDLVFVSEFDL